MVDCPLILLDSFCNMSIAESSNIWLPPVFKHLSPYSPNAKRRVKKTAPPGTVLLPRKMAALASDVVARFGSPYALSKALKKVGHPKNPACIYRWLYPYPKGTGGRIPKRAWMEIQIAAKRSGVSLKGVKTIPVRAGKWVPSVHSQKERRND